MSSMEKQGPVLGATAYCDGALVAEDVAFGLPEVAFQTWTANAMGALDLPALALTDSMEATITKIGVDVGLKRLLAGGPRALEFRWASDALDATGRARRVGHKAFLNLIPKKFPGISVAIGEPGENELSFAVTRFQLFNDGEETILIDKLAGILRINGEDLASEVNSLL